MLEDPTGKGNRLFEARHGKGSGETYRQEIESVVQSKMQVKDAGSNTYNTFEKSAFDKLKTTPLATLEKNREGIEAEYIKRYGPKQGAGLVDVIIAAKRKGMLGGSGG